MLQRFDSPLSDGAITLLGNASTIDELGDSVAPCVIVVATLTTRSPLSRATVSEYFG